ncbi:MAG: ATP-dependent sacrificial sulfur transferase LarE [Halanaerobiaceae bacterium]
MTDNNNINDIQIADDKLWTKFNQLQSILADMGELVVGFSGGVDSTFLLKIAAEVMGKENVLAVTSCAETYPSRELKEAEKLADNIGVEQVIIHTSELDNEDFTRNDKMRCYYCKRELFTNILKIAEERGFSYVADGSNYDDEINDYRPGMKAVSELDVKSPLKKAELTKKDIRKLSRSLGLPTWDKPSFACLSSRFPYGKEINKKELTKVDRAEEFLRKFSLHQIRVRNHDENMARIEVLPCDMEVLLANKKEIVAVMKELGYIYITLDLEGYRTGSMNEVLEER